MSDPVDPYDVRQVAAVVEGTWRLMGPDGVLDLLARLPGVRLDPGTPKRAFRAAVEGGTWLGPEHLLTWTDPVVHRHVVGGVVLQRAVLAPAEVPTVVAGLLIALTRSQGSGEDAAAVLTVARDVLERL
jgi:hypothetical protein